MSLPALPNPKAITASELAAAGGQLVRWAQDCEDVHAVRDAASRWQAITDYVRRSSSDGVAAAMASLRKLEERVGALVKAEREAGRMLRTPGRPSAEMVGATTISDTGITKQEAAEFVAMAEYSDVVDEVIAASSDDDPPSRRKVIAAIDAKKQGCAVVRTSTAGRTKVANELRVSTAKGLAARGMTSRQIAKHLGIGFKGFIDLRQRHGIEVPADAIVGRTRLLDSARIVRATVEAVDGIGMLFDQIAYDDLPAEDVQGWLPILDESIRSLTTLRNALRKVSQP